MPGYDLHTHTMFSDGTTTPEDNVRLALEIGLDGLGVTDHDTTGAHDRARAAAAGSDLEIVPGVEFSAESDGASVHLLAYWFDPADPDLAAEMQRIRGQRERRAQQMVERFNDLGIPVTMEQVRAAAGNAPIGRPHVASAVVEQGGAADVREVFDRWLHDGGAAYVPKYAVEPVRAIALLRAAGGAVVLAHPALHGRDRQGLDEAAVAAMAEAGLAGIEADHPDHTPAERSRYRRVAADHDLVTVAGSDFHGARKRLALGQATTSRRQLDRLRERLPAGTH